MNWVTVTNIFLLSVVLLNGSKTEILPYLEEHTIKTIKRHTIKTVTTAKVVAIIFITLPLVINMFLFYKIRIND